MFKMQFLRVSVLASLVVLSSSFALWPFASFFQPDPTTVAPAYTLQTSTPTPFNQQQVPSYSIFSPPASQVSKQPSNDFGVFTNNLIDNKHALFEMPPSSNLAQPKETQTISPTSSHGKRCFYEGKYYEPLTEISNGRSGDWCYGSYCNHEGKITHWDDFNCPLTITPPPAPTTKPPASDAGCIYQGVWYSPGADIDNYAMYGMCYGTYCDWTSHVVHWEDSCYATVPTVPPVPTPKPDIYKKK